jgi:D-sedoheptulose 7-phosphate isomerase
MERTLGERESLPCVLEGEGALVKRLAFDYLACFEKLLHELDVNAIERIVRRLQAARVCGATIYIAGNGGSASTASHWVNDLGKATKSNGLKAMRVMSLSDNVSWLTALANDEGYNRIFVGQLENFAQPGDILVVISASGNSPNLIEAVRLARSRELTTIALLGFDGGALKSMVDEYVWLPTPKGAYGLVESAHSFLCHVLTTCLAEIPLIYQSPEAQEFRLTDDKIPGEVGATRTG